MECFFSESRMQSINATGLNGNPGERSGETCGLFPGYQIIFILASFA
jgi:hypothetical protein